MGLSRVRSRPRRPALLLCGVLTAALVVAAYAIPLAIAAGCGYLALVCFQMLNVTGAILGVGACACAATILSSIVPRRDNSIPTSVLLDPAGAAVSSASAPID